MGAIHFFSVYFCCIFTVLFAQDRPKILYGLPPLPEDADLVRTTTTLAPIRHHTFPLLMFTLPPIPPMTPLPNLAGPFGVNPIPELPPIPESRLDGKYDNDGDFVPNSTPKPDKQVLENRIHGVKIEAIPHIFRPQQQSDPPRPYPNVRDIDIVTVSPTSRHGLHSSRSSEELDEETPKPSTTLRYGLHSSRSSEDDEPVKHHKQKNARQWQTTATKIVNQGSAIESSLLSGESIESIDKVAPEKSDFGKSQKMNAKAEVVVPIGPSAPITQKPSNRRELLTTKLLLGALGIPDTPASSTPPKKQHRLPPTNVVKPQNRVVKPRRPAPPNPNPQQQFFDYKPKPRTFQPEQKIVTKPPQIRNRIVPNRPRIPPQQQRIVPPVYVPPPVSILVILPPQPWNRDPQDAAFLQEVEEYDWRLHYKQQALQHQQGALTARARGPHQIIGNPQYTDEDFIALRNRETFTDNPPQKNLPLPDSGAQTSEVLIPFSNPRAPLSSSSLHSQVRANNNGFQQPQPQQQTFNQNYASVTQNPLFGGLFNNLFNFNQQGQQGGGGFLFPGFGR